MNNQKVNIVYTKSNLIIIDKKLIDTERNIHFEKFFIQIYLDYVVIGKICVLIIFNFKITMVYIFVSRIYK